VTDWKQRRKDWADGEMPAGASAPTPEQVEVYIDNANDELGPDCEQPVAVWCAEALRRAVLAATTKRYVVTLAEWRLVIDAGSEEQARDKAASELKEKIKPGLLIAWEDPLAHYTHPAAPVKGFR
jgi:hypothetical protein